MNFIDRVEGLEERGELKYCERCGGLFLRRLLESHVYCAVCAVYLAQQSNCDQGLRTKLPRKVRGRRWKKAEPAAAGRIDCLRGVAGEEVWA